MSAIRIRGRDRPEGTTMKRMREITVLLFASAMTTSAHGETFKPRLVADAGLLARAAFPSHLQHALAGTGLRLIPRRDCQIYLFNPRSAETAADIVIDRKLTSFKTFRLDTLRRVLLFDGKRPRNEAVLWYYYSTTGYPSKANQAVFDEKRVSWWRHRNDYNIWLADDARFPSTVTNLHGRADHIPAKKIAYHRRELMYEIQRYELVPSPPNYRDITFTCSTPPELDRPACVCVGSEGWVEP